MSTAGPVESDPGRPLRVHRPRAGETRTAVALALVVIGLLGYLFLSSLLVATGLQDVDPQEVYNPLYNDLGQDADDVRIAEAYGAIGFGAGLLACLPLVLGVWGRRPWAREGAFGVFGLGGFVLAALSFGGLRTDPPQSGALWGLLVGLALLAVVGVLASPGCTRDFARVAKDRELAERARERARRPARR
jgi:hypothetical protein